MKNKDYYLKGAKHVSTVKGNGSEAIGVLTNHKFEYEKEGFKSFWKSSHHIITIHKPHNST